MYRSDTHSNTYMRIQEKEANYCVVKDINADNGCASFQGFMCVIIGRNVR